MAAICKKICETLFGADESKDSEKTETVDIDSRTRRNELMGVTELNPDYVDPKPL